MFLPRGWLRDLLVFTWDTRALAGREKIYSYLRDMLQDAQISNMEIYHDRYTSPQMYFNTQVHSILGDIVNFAFTFECSKGHGRGYTTLHLNADQTYSASSMMMMLSDITGHEELRDAAWVDPEEIETRPYVLIVGAEQTGLQLGARMKAMRIPALVIEHDARIGDHWRRRYPTLTLQTPKRYHTLLYQQYPSKWPDYTPKDLMADWLEAYAVKQGLVVWTESELQPRPVYDISSGTWDVTILRRGAAGGAQTVRLRPSHIVITTGTLEKPYMPDCPGRDLYHGQVLHSHMFNGGSYFSGKRVIVVGAGCSAIDICQDLTRHGAGSVSMIQRSSSFVSSRKDLDSLLRHTWAVDRPIDVADFIFAALQGPKWHPPATALSTESTPPGTPRKQWTLEDINRELYGKLRKGGLKLNMGPEGAGLSMPVLEKVGGWDSGAANLIADGLIQVKSGTSPERFTETGLAFSDGTQLAADAIIFAAQLVLAPGTNRLRNQFANSWEKTLVDEEGEMKASYRRTGHPGLWFATGDIFVSRFYSKILALQIKARQLQNNLWNPQSTTPVVPTTVSPMDILCQSLNRLALSTETTG
ncbi:FAD/NAD-P-binding domain-containing protein [Trametes sanguinea]|nr:FAD/NAD-P-binding domain-containing protein [Trametes sanguinea]